MVRWFLFFLLSERERERKRAGERAERERLSFLKFFPTLFFFLSSFFKKTKTKTQQQINHSRPQALRPQRGHHGRGLDAHPRRPGARQEARGQGEEFFSFVSGRGRGRGRDFGGGEKMLTLFFPSFPSPPKKKQKNTTTSPRTPTSPSTPTRSSRSEQPSRPASSREKSATSSSSTSPRCRWGSRLSAAS